MMKKKVEGTDAPIEVMDTTLQRAAGTGWSLDAFAKVVTALTPILLALITYFTIINGQKATQAAKIAEATRQELIRTDSVSSVVLDTIHKIVNSQRTRMEAQNEGLRILLEKNGVKVPAGLITDAPDSVPKSVLVP